MGPVWCFIVVNLSIPVSLLKDLCSCSFGSLIVRKVLVLSYSVFVFDGERFCYADLEVP